MPTSSNDMRETCIRTERLIKHTKYVDAIIRNQQHQDFKTSGELQHSF